VTVLRVYPSEAGKKARAPAWSFGMGDSRSRSLTTKCVLKLPTKRYSRKGKRGGKHPAWGGGKEIGKCLLGVGLKSANGKKRRRQTAINTNDGPPGKGPKKVRGKEEGKKRTGKKKKQKTIVKRT